MVTGGGFIIMAASIYVAVKALLNGNGGYQFLAETEGTDIVIMCGEVFLFCLVIFLSIIYMIPVKGFHKCIIAELLFINRIIVHFDYLGGIWFLCVGKNNNNQ